MVVVPTPPRGFIEEVLRVRLCPQAGVPWSFPTIFLKRDKNKKFRFLPLPLKGQMLAIHLLSSLGAITWILCEGGPCTPGHKSCSPRAAFQGWKCLAPPSPPEILALRRGDKDRDPKAQGCQASQAFALPPFLLRRSPLGHREAVWHVGALRGESG